jgi:galactokinase
MEGLAREAVDHFLDIFGGIEPQVAVAPGRVNLIGDHTDYNEGFVLPMAIDRAAAVAFRPRPDALLRVHAVSCGETREADLRRLHPPGEGGFLAYVGGVAWALRESGLETPGIDIVLHGNVPIGAGLSSSAALELAVARALCAVRGTAWDAVAMAKLAQRAENEYVGMNCGLMDQLAAAVSAEGSALLLDCRSLDMRVVSIPAGATVVVMDTGARRALTASAYNERRASCQAATKALAALRPGLRALRDVDEGLLEAGRDRLDATTWRRARHVVAENQRPFALAAAFAKGDLLAAGRLMNESHASLRDLYEVSSPELDLVTELARRHEGCLGARLTGAGFGGCAVALVRVDHAPRFIADMTAAYSRERPSLPGAFFACRPQAGARLLEV